METRGRDQSADPGPEWRAAQAAPSRGHSGAKAINPRGLGTESPSVAACLHGNFEAMNGVSIKWAMDRLAVDFTAAGRIVVLVASVIFACCASCAKHTGPATGIRVDIASADTPCGDSPHLLVATAIGGHKAKLDQEPEASILEVCRRLRGILSYRAEKVVYVNAEADVPWGDFMELVD